MQAVETCTGCKNTATHQCQRVMLSVNLHGQQSAISLLTTDRKVYSNTSCGISNT